MVTLLLIYIYIYIFIYMYIYIYIYVVWLLLEEYCVAKKWVIIMDWTQGDRSQMRRRLQQEKKADLWLQIQLCQRVRRTCEEAAWKRRKTETMLTIVICTSYVTCVDVRCFL